MRERRLSSQLPPCTATSSATDSTKPGRSVPITVMTSFRSMRWRFRLYCRSYSPLLSRLNTLNPAFFASETESALGVLKVDQSRRTGFLHAGHWVNGLAERGRRRVNRPPHTLHSPSQSSYSYIGIDLIYFGLFLVKAPKRSMGTGRKVVVLCSLEISRMVCKKRN